jgi:hypothetical protein
MNAKAVEINCSACGRETLVRREPVYDGFVKKGERLLCASCGHEFPAEADVPFKVKQTVRVFGDDERPKKIDIFKGDEKGKNCRHCKHYVVNPFIQRCGLLHREVQATDLCARFDKKAAAAPANDVLSR